MLRGIYGSLVLVLCLGCGGGEHENLPAPTVPMVTINATSTPVGATVMLGTSTLGVTPLSGHAIPAPLNPAAVMDFNFTLAGHQNATARAQANGGVVNVNATLAPIVAPSAGGGGTADVLVRGRGGGRIRDMSSVSSTATVTNACTVQSMRIQLHGRHSYHGDLRASVRLPNGQDRSLVRGRGRSSGFFRARHRVRNVEGMPAAGNYRVTIRDRVRQDSGRFTGFTLTIDCQ